MVPEPLVSSAGTEGWVDMQLDTQTGQHPALPAFLLSLMAGWRKNRVFSAASH
jgi:hypothetical protein